MSVLHNLRCSRSFIPSKELPELIASVPNVCVNPVNLALVICTLSLDLSPFPYGQS